MSTIVFSNQSSVFFYYFVVDRYQVQMDSSTKIAAIPRIILDHQIMAEEMAKTKTTPRDRGAKPVMAATKWPDKTKKFLIDVDAALSTFDDQVSSMDNDDRETAYKTFSKAY